MKSKGRITVARRDSVATVTLDRPDALNALTMAMYDALGEACSELSSEPDLRAVVFRGAGGRALSAGTDIAVLAAFDGADDGVAYERDMDRYLDLVAHIPVPTVAVIEGLAVGGGLNIAAACDLRIATTDARFGVPIARTLGGCLSMRNFAGLADAFGASRARRMLLLGELIEADEARTCGFLARVVERTGLDDAVASIVETLVANAPITQRASKEALARIRKRSLPDGEDLIRQCYGSADFAGAVEAFFAKRKPVWRGV